ncbi:hypothetical protein LTR37_017219 [Vermiconidia calcicola]|uniref:Uncharacterized protein n=1 Tax=Vermiconidia calcicola TaxID=1690605 RepID=A0ACC3MLV9_9PEZI|nr:hypothetical protein LTR37_017219 [Vermiconidia calcicola]
MHCCGDREQIGERAGGAVGGDLLRQRGPNDDRISEVQLWELRGTGVHRLEAMKSATLISFGDTPGLLLFIFRNSYEAEEMMKSYVVIMDLLYRLSNIYTQGKNSALPFWNRGFNSLFSIAKRMCSATIKDIYTPNAVADLTSPSSKKAVLFTLSNARRYDRIFVNGMMEYLEVETVYDLAHQSGFMLVTNITEMNEKPKKSYNTFFSCPVNDSKSIMKKYVPFSEASAVKYWLELPTRSAERLVDKKNEFFKMEIDKNFDDIMKENEKNLSNTNTLYNDLCNDLYNDLKDNGIYIDKHLIRMKRRFEWQETMTIHS